MKLCTEQSVQSGEKWQCRQLDHDEPSTSTASYKQQPDATAVCLCYSEVTAMK